MKKILMLDIGGTNVKLMASGQVGRRKIPSGKELTPAQMVRRVLKATEDWPFEAVSLGFPGVVVGGKIASEPVNLGGGWVKFDFEKAFGRPVRYINDASMQALANYEKGRMLFLGFGTGTGASIVVDDVLIPLEIGALRLRRRGNFGDLLSEASRQRLGNEAWLATVREAVEIMQSVFRPDDTVLGGGNSKWIEPLPKGCRRKDNQGAFVGALRLWPDADMLAEPYGTSYRIKKAAHSEFPSALPALLLPQNRSRKKSQPKKAKRAKKAGARTG
jgi:polyphosphate glucokinase